MFIPPKKKKTNKHPKTSGFGRFSVEKNAWICFPRLIINVFFEASVPGRVEISFFGGSKNDIVKLSSAVFLHCQIVFSYTEMVGDGSSDRNGGVR